MRLPEALQRAAQPATVAAPAPAVGPEAATGALADQPDAYAIALDGGAHAGFLGDKRALTAAMIRKSIRSIEAQIAQHEAWIADPVAKLGDLAQHDERRVRALIEKKWPADIARQRAQIQILQGILREKGDA